MSKEEQKFDLLTFLRDMMKLEYRNDYGRMLKLFELETQNIDTYEIKLSFRFISSTKLTDSIIDSIRKLCDKYDINQKDRFFTVQGEYLMFVIEKRV